MRGRQARCRELGRIGVAQNRVGIALEPLHRRKLAGLAGLHGGVVVLPFGREIRQRAVEPGRIRGPDMGGEAADGFRHHAAIQRVDPLQRRRRRRQRGCGDGARNGHHRPHGTGVGAEVAGDQNTGVIDRVGRLNDLGEAVFEIAVLIELLEGAVVHHRGKRRVGHHHVVEEVGDGGFAVVGAAADIIRLAADLVLHVVGVAIVLRGRGRVQPVAFEAEGLQRLVALERLLHLHIGIGVELGVRVDAVLRLVDLHRRIDRVEFALRVLHEQRLVGGRLVGLGGVQQHCLGVALHPLQRVQGGAVAGEHHAVVAAPFRLKIGRRGVEPRRIRRPAMGGDAGDRGRDQTAVERGHGHRAGHRALLALPEF